MFAKKLHVCIAKWIATCYCTIDALHKLQSTVLLRTVGRNERGAVHCSQCAQLLCKRNAHAFACQIFPLPPPPSSSFHPSIVLLVDADSFLRADRGLHRSPGHSFLKSKCKLFEVCLFLRRFKSLTILKVLVLFRSHPLSYRAYSFKRYCLTYIKVAGRGICDQNTKYHLAHANFILLGDQA